MSVALNTVRPERLTARLDDEVIVFLIGMRVNSLWKIWRWLPVALAMQRMLRELQAREDSPLLAVQGNSPSVIVQYWRSFDELIAYASDRDGEHYPAWADFNRKLKKAGDVGIWHETYAVSPDRVESVYHHMPPTGLGRFAPLEPARGHLKSARDRMGSARPARRADAA